MIFVWFDFPVGMSRSQMHASLLVDLLCTMYNQDHCLKKSFFKRCVRWFKNNISSIYTIIIIIQTI